MIYVLYDKPKKLEDMSFLTAAFEKEYKEIYPEWQMHFYQANALSVQYNRKTYKIR